MLDSDVQKKGQKINEGKTKYSEARRNITNKSANPTVENYTFERVQQFSYLRSEITQNNSCSY